MTFAKCLVAIPALLLGFVLPGSAQEIRVTRKFEDTHPARSAVSKNKKVLYFPRADNRFEAVEIDTGKSLWTTSATAKPLATQGDTVFALIDEKPGAFRLAAFDVSSGKLMKSSDPYVLPAPDVKLSIEAGGDGKRYYASLKRTDKLKAKAPEDNPSEKKLPSALFFEPSTGKIEEAKGAFGGVATVTRDEKLPKPERAKDLPAANFQTYAPFISGDRVIQVYYGRNTIGAGVLSVQWDKASGKHLETKEMFSNPAGNSLGTSISPIGGGRYVIFKGPNDKERTLISAETGKRTFTVPRDMQLDWLVGTRLLGVQRGPQGKAVGDTKLTAYDPGTGKMVWELACNPLVGR